MKYRKLAVALALLALPGSAPGGTKPDRWLEVRSPHFVVISNAGEEQARDVSQEFERDRRTGALRPSGRSDEPGKDRSYLMPTDSPSRLPRLCKAAFGEKAVLCS